MYSLDDIKSEYESPVQDSAPASSKPKTKTSDKKFRKVKGDLEEQDLEIDVDAQMIYLDKKWWSKEDFREMILKENEVGNDVQLYTDAFKRLKRASEKGGKVPKSQKSSEKVANVEVTRGFSISGETIKFGVKVHNLNPHKLYDIDVILRVPSALKILSPKDKKVTIDSLDPGASESAIFMLKPDRCVSGFIKGTVTYENPLNGEICTTVMKPKKLHSICPFLSPMEISESEYIGHTGEFHSTSTGISFTGINLTTAASIVAKRCAQLHLVGSCASNDQRLLMMAGRSEVERMKYLLTVVLSEEEEGIKLTLNGYSDREEGLAGFLSEISDSIRYTIKNMASSKEVTKVEVHNVQNIIDSVLVRSNVECSDGHKKGGDVTITDSVMIGSSIGKGKKKTRAGSAEEDISNWD